MEWLSSLFLEHSALQAVVVLSLISAIGLGLGRVHFWGISLGVTFVFFAGILAGHFGLSVDPQMLNYAESFGLVIFVYSLGLQVGPGFFSSFRKGGVTLNMLGLGVVLLGTLLTVVASYATGISLPDMVGILCGATTNTPALGAAQQTLKQMGMDSSTPALGCAVAYPMGVVGVILAVLLIRKVLVRKEDLEIKEKDDANKTYIAAFQVHNPAIFNKSIKDIAHLSYPKFVISRLWRDGHVSIPTSDKVLKEGDRLLVITAEKDALALTVLFGEQENTDWNKEDIDWNAIDSELVSQRIVVTRPELNGKKLGALRLRNHYGINISRVYRSGVQLLATPGLILQLGDRLTVVGEKAAIQNVEKVLGAESLAANAATFMEEIRPVRNHMCERIFAEIEDVELNGHKEHHLTNHLNIRIKNVSAAVVQKALKEQEIEVGIGTNSNILAAIGRSKAESAESVSFSLKAGTTMEDVDKIVDNLKEIVTGERTIL